MPNLKGLVCQLNYNCSGMLEPLPMSGLPKHVPFLKSPLSLRVGQTVCFRIVSTGDDVQAVGISLESDVQPHQEREMLDLPADASCLNTSSTLTLGKHVETSQSLDIGDVMSSVPAQSHSRCFLRRMGQFRNSPQAEQVQLVVEAEGSLEKLLGQSTRKCARWLHPPVLQSANPQRQFAQMNEKGTEYQVHLQERIRKILIEALNHLDLQDPSTFDAMKAALFYMASLCQRLNEKCSSSSATLAKTHARTQWLELKSLLADSLVSDSCSYQPPLPKSRRSAQAQLPSQRHKYTKPDEREVRCCRGCRTWSQNYRVLRTYCNHQGFINSFARYASQVDVLRVPFHRDK